MTNITVWGYDFQIRDVLLRLRQQSTLLCRQLIRAANNCGSLSTRFAPRRWPVHCAKGVIVF